MFKLSSFVVLAIVVVLIVIATATTQVFAQPPPNVGIPDCSKTPDDCTKQIQDILDDPTKTELMLLPGQRNEQNGGPLPYVTLPLFLRNRKNGFRIFCPAPVRSQAMNWGTLLAKRCPKASSLASSSSSSSSAQEVGKNGFNSSTSAPLPCTEYAGTGDSLLSIENSKNVVIEGDCMFRMWRQDYANPKLYVKAEWRMALRLIDTENTIVRNGVHFENSGGDGIYISCSRGKAGMLNSKNITLDNIKSYDNYRQGMSVICVNGLTVKNSEFSNTAGTAPMAGLDFEPDWFWQQIINVTLDTITFRNNSGYCIQISMYALSDETPQLNKNFWSLKNINCERNGLNGLDKKRFQGQRGGIYFSMNERITVPPTIFTFSNITVNQAGGPGLTVSKGAYPILKFTDNLVIINASTDEQAATLAPITILPPTSNVYVTGNGNTLIDPSIYSAKKMRDWIQVFPPSARFDQKKVKNIVVLFDDVATESGVCPANLPPLDQCENVHVKPGSCSPI